MMREMTIKLDYEIHSYNKGKYKNVKHDRNTFAKPDMNTRINIRFPRIS